MPQLHAAYCVPEVLETLTPPGNLVARALLRSLANFELDADRKLLAFDGGRTELAGLIAVAINLTSRGLPTRAPLALSESVLRAGWPGEVALYDEGQRGVGFDLADVPVDFKHVLLRALHVTEPRLNADAFSKATRANYPLDSQAEHSFLNDVVAARLGVGLAQALVPQAPLDTLLHMALKESSESSKLDRQDVRDALQQSVDFALPLPYYASEAPAGLILEVDGPQHRERVQKIKDDARAEAAKLANWYTDRLPVEEFARPDQWLTNLIRQGNTHPFCLGLRQNYDEPLHGFDAGRRAEQLILSPVLAARVHRALLEAIVGGILRWDQPVWRVTIVERDVPGSRLGAEAFIEQLEKLFALEGAGRSVPAVELTVFSSIEYAAYSLHEHQRVVPIAQYSPDATQHLVLDVAVLARAGLVAPVTSAPGVARFVVRSSGIPLESRRVVTAPLIRYADVSKPSLDDEYLHVPVPGTADALRFFLRDIFRKSDFRPGQLPILKRGLQGNSVLGLLPTGGGKSLTYQLAGLLQPGVSLVVDPIKSLMQDQYEGLLNDWIDTASFLNSSVFKSAQQRLNRLEQGEALFFFISPERLQIQGFRNLLSRMTVTPEKTIGFSFCVVDEAHCVSEWGHDFRTQYLRLGTTARRFCRTYDRKEIPVYGLTATASFDVLADVQRELALPDQEAIVRTRTTRRRELRFRVLPVAAANKHLRIKDILSLVPSELVQWSAQAAELRNDPAHAAAASDGTSPEGRLPRPLKSTFKASDFYGVDAQGSYTNAGLIFCPHKSAKVPTGVESVLASIGEIHHVRAGKFTAGYADFGVPEAAVEAEEMMQAQRDFIGNKLNMMVATKAFGMGIDKPNVRFTIHYCYPASIESLVQEAGRAGRDGTVALNYILFDPEDASINESFFKRNFRGRRKEALMLNELLTRVSLPANSKLEHLREILLDEFAGMSIAPLTGGIWQKDGKDRLYINQDFQQSYGFVDLRSSGFAFSTANRHASIAQNLAQAVMQRVSAWLQEEVPVAARTSIATLVRWLLEVSASTSIPGILPTIANAPADQEPPTLVIGFKNGESNWISQLLGSVVPESLIWKAAGFATNRDQFVTNLLAEYKRGYGRSLQLTEEEVAAVGPHFDRLRDEQDTYKAVHRLTLLDVVADYTIDYGAKTITLYLNKKPADEGVYKEAFVRYLSRYTTLTRARELAEKGARREKGETLLEKILGELLDFTYGEIADKRQRATKEMALACEKGAAEPDEDLGEFFDLYFNSKYARAEYLPKHTRGGAHFDRRLLWDYLSYMDAPPDGIGKERDNVKHLRGACARMLSAGADKNGAVLLLDAFALFFLEAERKVPLPKVLAAASEKLLLGFRYFQEQDALQDDELMAFFDEYAAKAGAIEPDVGQRLRDTLRELVLLDTNRRWLGAFNDRFDDRPTAQSALPVESVF